MFPVLHHPEKEQSLQLLEANQEIENTTTTIILKFEHGSMITMANAPLKGVNESKTRLLCRLAVFWQTLQIPRNVVMIVFSIILRYHFKISLESWEIQSHGSQFILIPSQWRRNRKVLNYYFLSFFSQTKMTQTLSADPLSSASCATNLAIFLFRNSGVRTIFPFFVFTLCVGHSSISCTKSTTS